MQVPRPEPERTLPTGSAPDREAAWLLSRAALQLDQDETADAMLALAAGFGTEDSPSPEPAPYIGSRRCADCHPAIFQAQQRESPHAKTLYLGSDLKDVPLPAQPVPDPVAPGITHRFSRLADDRIELETRVKDQAVRAVIEYAVGSGRHGITMVAKDEPTGIDRELRISYFSTDQTWGETKGINFLPHDPGDYIGLGLSAKAPAPVPALPHDLVPRRRSDPLTPARPRGARPRDRLRAVPRPRAQPRQGRHFGIRRAGDRPDPAHATPPALAVLQRVPRLQRLGRAQRPGIHPRPGNHADVQPLLHRHQWRASTAPPATTRIAALIPPCPTTTPNAWAVTPRRRPSPAHRHRPIPARPSPHARPVDLPGQSGHRLHLLPHAQGPGSLPTYPVHRPPHSHPSPGRRVTDGWRVAGKYWYALNLTR